MLKAISSLCIMFFSLSYCFPVTAQNTNEIQHIVVFGDSLSDNGNYFRDSSKSGQPLPKPPYYQGRASNGPIWIEYLASSMNADLEDEAYIGAPTTDKDGKKNPGYPFEVSLADQVANYLKKHDGQPLDGKHTLFVLWAGGNNIFMLDAKNPYNPFSFSPPRDIYQAVSLLHKNGGNLFLLPGLPNFSKIPLGQVIGDPLKTIMGIFSEQFNYGIQNVASIVNDLNSNDKSNNFHIVWSDIDAFFTGIQENASQYGFSNTNNACDPGVPNNPGPVVCPAPNTYLFWDLVHPTTKGHCYLAWHVHQDLAKQNWVPAPPPEEFNACFKIGEKKTEIHNQATTP